MFFSQRFKVMSTRVTTLAAMGVMAGCGLNPFDGDRDTVPEQPVRSVSESDVISLEGRRGSREGAATTTRAMTNTSAATSAVPLADDAPNRYVVKRGDTLWDISSTFLRDPWYWPEIWQVNPQVENPHLIYPGDILNLIYVDGRPTLQLTRGVTAQRLSPQIRVQQLDEAINTISYEQIAAFLSKGMILEQSEIAQLPYMLASRGDHLIAGAGNDIYAREEPNGLQLRGIGSRYSLIDVGDALIDPDDGDILGYEGTYVGQGQLRRDGDPATLRLVESSREAVPGDRLIDQEIDIPLNFFPKAPQTAINGQIVSVVDGVSLIGQFQVVVLNRGLNHGLVPGDVLSVFESGETVRDRFRNGSSGFLSSGGEQVTLPDERAGTIMVFKSYDRVSYALVMEAESEMQVLDRVSNPE